MKIRALKGLKTAATENQQVSYKEQLQSSLFLTPR